MNLYYKRDGTPYEGRDAVLQWAKNFETTNRVVKQTKLKNGYYISTVWLGLNHAIDDKVPPLIFESMVFVNGDEEECQRYSTEQEAKEGHKELVAKYRKLT